jgi:SecD/SecF fusion protein
VLAMAGEGDFLLLAQAENVPTTETGAAPEKAQDPAPAAPKEQAPPQTTGQEAAQQPVAQGSARSELDFRYRISADALKFQMAGAAQKAGIDLDADRVEVKASDAQEKNWAVTLPVSTENAGKILQQLQTDFANTPVYPSASKIGSKVAADMQQTAIMAMVLSFLGIVIYLWVRFQRVAYGLAAVIATVHDVLVTIAVIALTHWLEPFMGWLLVENFKISLTVIAAFLTLIGYSINDKIVIFDRVREVRGKSPHLSLAIINESVNQTLSRTILTGGTVLVSLLVIYIFGGQGIRAFAFTLLVGIVVGTWSSIYIGAPALLWLAEGVAKTPETKPAADKLAKVPAERA